MHDAFEDMFAHPAPGIWFGAHAHAEVPARLIPTQHHAQPPADDAALAALRIRLEQLPDRGASVIDFYSRHDGAALCILPDPLNNRDMPALALLPIDAMEGADDAIRWLHEGLEHIYSPGSYLPIAVTPSEGAVLSLLLTGELDGRPLAGTIVYLSLDPVLDCNQPICDSFTDLLRWIAKEPAEFLNAIGFCGAVRGAGAEEGWFGDPPQRYVADRGGPSASL